MYVFSSIKPDLTMDGASLGFSLINRPAAGRCVFSTSLLGQDDVHGTTGWAGGQVGVRACYSARTLLGVPKYSATIQRPIHAASIHEPCNAWCAAQYTCCTDLHVPCRRPTATHCPRTIPAVQNITLLPNFKLAQPCRQ